MHKKTYLSKIFALIMTFAISMMLVPTVNAAALTSVTAVMSRQASSQASNYDVSFVTPTGVTAAQTITLTWPAGFTMSTIVFGDVDMRDNGSPVTLAATPSAATWGAAVSGQVLTLTSATGTIAAGHTVRILIGTNTTDGGVGTHQIANNSSIGTYVVSIGGTMADSGSFAVPIVTTDQVTLSATVSTSMTFTLSGNSSAFGSLSTGSVNPGGTDITLTAASNTNAGYTVSVRDQGDGSTGGLYNSGATYNIASATATLSAGNEGYGIQASTATGATLSATYNKTSNNVGGLTVAPQTLFSRAAANTANDTVLIHHLAAISGFTKAGTYADTITYVATGNY